MIFANGRLLPDSQLSQVLEELEEAVNETRACRTLEPETVISALQAVGERPQSDHFPVSEWSHPW